MLSRSYNIILIFLYNKKEENCYCVSWYVVTTCLLDNSLRYLNGISSHYASRGGVFDGFLCAVDPHRSRLASRLAAVAPLLFNTLIVTNTITILRIFFTYFFRSINKFSNKIIRKIHLKSSIYTPMKHIILFYKIMKFFWLLVKLIITLNLKQSSSYKPSLENNKKTW